MKTITAKVKTSGELLKEASGWTEKGSLIINGAEFTLKMRRHCGEMIVLNSWNNGSGYEMNNDHLFTKEMLKCAR